MARPSRYRRRVNSRRRKTVRNVGWTPIRAKTSPYAEDGFRYEVRLRAYRLFYNQQGLLDDETSKAQTDLIDMIRRCCGRYKIATTRGKHHTVQHTIYLSSDSDLVLAKLSIDSDEVFRVYELKSAPPAQ